MILNTGSRTDIPAYYSDWFFNRVKEGFVLVRNPYYPTQVTRYRISPDVVDCLCFCTKNPEPMLDRLGELAAFHQFWCVTITPYGKEIEPHVPDKKQVIQSFRRLAAVTGPKAISWRYDPIVLTETYSLDFHLERFARMAKALEGCTESCVISFIDLYEKTRRNFPQAREVSKRDRLILGREFIRIGKQHGMTIRTCCEGDELAPYGADTSGCMTQAVLERAIGCSLDVPKSRSMARGTACSCLLGNDIGAYNTCGHGCLYCYANEAQRLVRENRRLHRPDSPFLIGGFLDGDEIREAKQKSFLDGQMRLSDFL